VSLATGLAQVATAAYAAVQASYATLLAKFPVVAADLAANAVTTVKILDGAITFAKLATNSATTLAYAASPSTTNSVSSNVQIQTVSTPDWKGTGAGFAIWVAYINHSTIGAVCTLSYSVDAAGLNTMQVMQISVAGYALPIVGIIPLIGIAAGSHTHKFTFTSNTATNWTLGSGYIIVVELAK
jgi:hypothetical protein